ncbi:MAG: anhydro-N-acetylmuramic acid kinase [Acidobacteria bacterium]|nr:anhydro-N-acetylmuramic acid kinase [Acidobacteriota bacterium]
MLVAGLMSGTSADGIDVAVVEITGLGWDTQIQLRAFRSIPCPHQVRRRVLEIASGIPVPASEISQMNFLLGELFARACQTVCRRAGIPLQQLDLIGSHGQTIFHQNRSTHFCGQPVRSTLQIGEPAIIAERTGVTTIADFRPADIAASGQGAPLVPFFDYLLFQHPQRGRVVLNIGGIANLTAIPAGGKPEDVIAFDTGPGNMLLDALARRATKGRSAYDPQGRLARQGRISEPLVRRLLQQKYFRLPPPKTAGREQFGQQYLERYFFREFGHSHQGILNALATATAFTAAAIARAISGFVLPKFPVEECFVSGGGLKNHFLMKQLDQRLQAMARRAGNSAIRILSSDSTGIPADAKEAVAFAVLAYHTYHQKPSNLCAATGARHPAILGKIAYGKV